MRNLARKTMTATLTVAATAAFGLGASSEAWGKKSSEWDRVGTTAKSSEWDRAGTTAKSSEWDRAGTTAKSSEWDRAGTTAKSSEWD